ncbi:MAG: metal ABC transporter permease [Gemmataceae bacterium]|nr:metal ABC transporter permease [Gemmataceae bacterium]
MGSIHIELQLMTAVTAVACALPGVFLVLRRMAMMSDAISHTVLLGIVLAFFLTHDLRSPWLMGGAVLMGVVTVSLVELLHRTGRVREDAAIGLTFPMLFSVAVLLISLHFSDIHLDTDAVLTGAPEMAILNSLTIDGRDYGPQALYVMLGILVLNVTFIAVFYKELKLATFDPGLATALGFSPALVHYGLMTLVSVTAVGAFDVVGSILVVALMVGPPATAYLLTDRLGRMLGLSAAIGAGCAVSGCWLTRALPSASVAGAIATQTGVAFALAFLLAPQRGLIAMGLRRLRQRWEFAQTMLVIHLFNHEDRPEAERESAIAGLHEHLHWPPVFVTRVARQAERRELVVQRDGRLILTDNGRRLAKQALVN